MALMTEDGTLADNCGWMKDKELTRDVVVHACLQASFSVANHCDNWCLVLSVCLRNQNTY